MLENAYLIVVNIHIGKDILRNGIDNVARLEEIGDTHRALALNDSLLVVRITAIDFLGDSLVDTGRENKASRHLTLLNLIGEPWILRKLGIGEHIGFDIVQCQREFLILRVLVIVAIGKVRFFLIGNNLSHEFHGRIALATVFAALGLDGDFAHRLGILLKYHQQTVAIGTDGDCLGLIAHGTERQFLSHLLGDGEIAAVVSHRGDFLSFILNSNEAQAVARLVVNNITCYLFLCK